MDPILQALNAEMEAKRIEADALSAKDGASDEELEHANALYNDCDELVDKIKARHGTVEKQQQLQERSVAYRSFQEDPTGALIAAAVAKGTEGANVGVTFTTSGSSSGNGNGQGGNAHGTPPFWHAQARGSMESEQQKFLRVGPWKGLGHLAFEIKRSGSERPGFINDGLLGTWNRGVLKYDNHVKGLSVEVKAAQGLNEFSDSDGGVAVPVEIAAGIWERTQGEDSLLARIGATPVTGNSLKIKAWNDKTRTGDVLFGGARAYWTAEAAQITKSSPTFRDIDLRLNKLAVLIYATEELLADAPALQAELNRIAGACFTYKINQAIIRGTGVGQPQGLLNSPAKITQAAVSAQGANTIVAQNIDEMFARRAPGSSRNVIWLYTIDAEAQLNKLVYATGSSSGQLVNMPPTGLAGMPNTSLKGRELVESEHASALGTEGDIILWDPSSHAAIVKSNGINQAASMHLRFDYDEVAFKFTFRMDARSRWEAPLTPAQSTNTRSPIVTLNSTRT